MRHGGVGVWRVLLALTPWMDMAGRMEMDGSFASGTSTSPRLCSANHQTQPPGQGFLTQTTAQNAGAPGLCYAHTSLTAFGRPALPNPILPVIALLHTVVEFLRSSTSPFGPQMMEDDAGL
jgi:hypothetical protein